MDYGGEE